jgi:hypothetical protein
MTLNILWCVSHLDKQEKKRLWALGNEWGKRRYRCYTIEKVVVEQKIVCSLRRCAPQRPIAELRLLLRLTTSIVKILCSTKRPCSTVVEQRILTIEVVKRNNNLGSAIGRCGAHRRKLRTTFWQVYYFFIGITSITKVLLALLLLQISFSYKPFGWWRKSTFLKKNLIFDV